MFYILLGYRLQMISSIWAKLEIAKSIQLQMWKSFTITSIFNKCLDKLITSITTKPYILTENSISLNLFKIHQVLSWAYFLSLTLWRLEAKKTPIRSQKWEEGVDFLKNIFTKRCSTTSKNPWRIQSDLSYDLSYEK